MDKYYKLSNPASFGGVKKLQRASHKSKNAVKRYLLSQEVYTRHRQVNKKFTRNKFVVSGPKQQVQADTTDWSKFHHEGHPYMLFLIDSFSKKAWGLPLKDKTAASAVKAMEPLLRANSWQSIYTDRGTEFLNSSVQSLFKKYKVKHWLSSSIHKAAFAERVQLTIKQKLFKYLESRPTNKHSFLTDVKHTFRSYNAASHSSHGLPPNQVHEMNKTEARKLWPILYSDAKVVKPKFLVIIIILFS